MVSIALVQTWIMHAAANAAFRAMYKYIYNGCDSTACSIDDAIAIAVVMYLSEAVYHVG